MGIGDLWMNERKCIEGPASFRGRASTANLSLGARPFSAGLPSASHRSARPSRACAFRLSVGGGVRSAQSGLPRAWSGGKAASLPPCVARPPKRWLTGWAARWGPPGPSSCEGGGLLESPWGGPEGLGGGAEPWSPCPTWPRSQVSELEGSLGRFRATHLVQQVEKLSFKEGRICSKSQWVSVRLGTRCP